MALYDKKMKQLREARDRFYKRSINLFSPDGAQKHSNDEHVERLEGMVEQFDITARKLVKKAERDEQREQVALAKLPKSVQAQKAQLRLQAAQILKKGVLDERARIVNEEGKPVLPRLTRPLFPEQ